MFLLYNLHRLEVAANGALGITAEDVGVTSESATSDAWGISRNGARRRAPSIAPNGAPSRMPKFTLYLKSYSRTG